MEIWRHAAGVASLPQELWSSSVLFVIVGISSFRSSPVPKINFNHLRKYSLKLSGVAQNWRPFSGSTLNFSGPRW